MTRRRMGRPIEPVCFLCSNKVKKYQSRYHIPVDWVRFSEEGPKLNFRENLVVHMSCYKKISKKRLEKALKLHIESIL